MERHGWGFGAYVCAIIFLFSTFAGASVGLDPVATPQVSVPGGTYHVEQNPALTCSTPGAIIRYTLDGTDPNDGVVYEPNALIIDRSLTLKAVGLKEGMAPSPGLTVDYRLVVATPKFKPEEGTYFTEPNEIVVTISCATPGAVIHYTTDGNDPTESDPVITSGDSLYLDCGTTLKARAWKEPMEPSEVRTSEYALYVAYITPSLSPVPIYNTEQTVTLTCWTPGAMIHYTTNGMDPTESDPAIVSGESIDLDRSLTLKARGWKAGYNPGQMLTLSYKLVAATPVFSVAGGTYNTEQTVTITCATPEAVIHYTTNGVEPTEADPVIASGDSLFIDRSMTLKARAWKGALTPSVIRSENYNMVAAEPVFTPDGGRYETEQTVTITCATPGAMIYYTIDGSDPAQSGMLIENGGTVTVAVNPETTLKAIAYKDNLVPSTKTAGYRQAFIIYVNAAATGANTGANWADAFTDLQSALDAAVAGDEIWVAAGTYKPTKMTGGTGERFKAYQLKNDVGVYGGFNGTETDKSQRNWDANPTILSGDLNGDDNDVILPTEPTRQDNCYHVFNHLAGTNLTTSAVLDGFVITGGNGTGSQAFGGGMFNDASSPTISHCTFRANSAASTMLNSFFRASGGAILNYQSSAPIISHCVFTGNYGSYGGGLLNTYASAPMIIDCSFTANSAMVGGGMYNGASQSGWAPANPTISRCTFNNNSSDFCGGGIYSGNGTSLTITNCAFNRNSASSDGGGICGYSFTLSMSNCIFSQNSAAYTGGGLAISMSTNPLIINSTFSGNSSGRYGGGIAIDSGYTLNNCIVWGNTAGTPYSKQITFISGMSVNYCNIQGQVAYGPGNISADPLFVDAANGNLRLKPGSPCIDAGSNAAIPAGITTDLAGNLRIVDGNSDSNPIVDIGAFEYTIYERVAAPVILPAGGTYNAEQNVTITCATAGAVIRYTLDGSDPNNGMIYEAGTTIPVEQSLTLRAVGLNAYMIPSEGAAAAYRLVVATPTFTPDNGRYLTDQTVQVACATPEAVIYYTTDGTDPAQCGTIIENGGTVTVSVNPATTLKAIAFKGNMESSAIKSASYAQSHIIYVNAAATGANNGKTWANAFTRLQYALDDLSDYSAKPGDEIWVAAGTYKPTKAVGGTELQFRTFQMKKDVGIYGGFNGTETSRDQRDWVVNRTILSGDLYGNDVRTPAGPLPWGNRGENCYHVVMSKGNLGGAVLDGFTIIGGNAVGRDDFNGGGMYNFGSTITVRHCIFTANTTMSGMSGSGGGMYNSNSSPLIIDCVFVNNYSRRGGGMANVSGSNPTLIDCVFSDNIAAGGIEQAPSAGGGMYNWFSCSPIITNCIFNGNSSVLGGAVYNYSSSRPVFTNCILRANLAASAGGALFGMIQSSPTMTNCILWSNTAPMGPQIYGDSSDPIITYSNIEGGWTGEGNIDTDPLFVDAANGDLRLQAGSPCIDKGSNDAIPMGVAADLAGTPRIVDGNCDGNAVVDMGAYEYFLPGDLNTTCSVNVEDLSLFSPYWLAVDCTSPDNCGQADIDRNGVVDLSDFAILAGHWMKGI